MSLQTKLIALLVVLVVGFGSGFGVRAYIASKDAVVAENQDLKQDKTELLGFVDKIDQRDAVNQKLNTELRSIQLQSSQALNDKLAENTRLATDRGVALGMRLKGSSCPDPGASGSAASGAVADVSDILLGDETRQLVFDLRSEVTLDAAQIEGLKGHVAYLEHQIAEHQRLHHTAVK